MWNSPTWCFECYVFYVSGARGGWGCAARFSKSWPYFRPKTVIFLTRFQTSKIHTRFQTAWPLGRIYVIMAYISTNKKFLQMHFEFAYFYFVHIRLELKRKIRSYTPVRTRLWRLWICFKTFVAPFLPTRDCPWIFFLDFRGLKRRYSSESRGGGGGVRSAWMRGKKNAVFSLIVFSHVATWVQFKAPLAVQLVSKYKN